jgi:hypothetical protein
MAWSTGFFALMAWIWAMAQEKNIVVMSGWSPMRVALKYRNRVLYGLTQVIMAVAIGHLESVLHQTTDQIETESTCGMSERLGKDLMPHSRSCA